jgi:hypothetical protein
MNAVIPNPHSSMEQYWRFTNADVEELYAGGNITAKSTRFGPRVLVIRAALAQYLADRAQ